jgi:hypothetical protein
MVKATDGGDSRQLPLARLSVLALGMGVVTGLGVALFLNLVGLIHSLFAGHASYPARRNAR